MWYFMHEKRPVIKNKKILNKVVYVCFFSLPLLLNAICVIGQQFLMDFSFQKQAVTGTSRYRNRIYFFKFYYRDRLNLRWPPPQPIVVVALSPFVISSLWGHHSSNIDVFTIGSMMVRAAALFFLLLLCPHLEAHVKHGKILLLYPKERWILRGHHTTSEGFSQCGNSLAWNPVIFLRTCK